MFDAERVARENISWNPIGTWRTDLYALCVTDIFISYLALLVRRQNCHSTEPLPPALAGHALNTRDISDYGGANNTFTCIDWRETSGSCLWLLLFSSLHHCHHQVRFIAHTSWIRPRRLQSRQSDAESLRASIPANRRLTQVCSPRSAHRSHPCQQSGWRKKTTASGRKSQSLTPKAKHPVPTHRQTQVLLSRLPLRLPIKPTTSSAKTSLALLK